jgi:hypothetical protein
MLPQQQQQRIRAIDLSYVSRSNQKFHGSLCGEGRPGRQLPPSQSREDRTPSPVGLSMQRP